MAGQALFLSFLVSSCLWGMKDISQNDNKNKKIKYTKGQGLNFNFPSNENEQKIVAREIVESLHNQGLTTNDLFKDHLKAKKEKVYELIAESSIGGKRLVKQELKRMLNYFKKKEDAKKGSIKFQACFSEKVKSVVVSVFENAKITYPISVEGKVINSDNIVAQVSTNFNYTNYSFDRITRALQLPLSLWGDDSGCKNIVEKDFLQANALLACAAKHITRWHAEKNYVLDLFLSARNTKPEIIDIINDSFLQYKKNEADLLSFMDEHSSVAMEHYFRSELNEKEQRPSEYLQLDEIGKIMSLHDAEQRAWDERMERNATIVNMYSALISPQSPLRSFLLPPSMKTSLFNSIPLHPGIKEFERSSPFPLHPAIKEFERSSPFRLLLGHPEMNIKNDDPKDIENEPFFSEPLILLSKSKPLREYSLDELMRKDIGEFEQRFNELAEDKNFDINPIFISARKQGNMPVLEFLLTKNGIDVNHKLNDGIGETLLHDVCTYSWNFDIDLLKKLVTYNGIDLNIPKKDNLTALNLLAIYHPRKEYLPFFSLLLSHKADPNIADSCILKTPLHRLSINCDAVELIKLFLDSPATDPNLQDDEGNTPLHLAVETSQCPEIVRLLLKHPKINLNILNNEGKNPLMVNSPDTKSISLLLSHKADPNIADSRTLRTPLHWLSMDWEMGWKAVKLVKLFLGNPATDPNLQDYEGNTPLHLAVENAQCPAIVRLFLEHPKINLNILNKEGESPLTVNSPDTKTIELLKEFNSTKSNDDPKDIKNGRGDAKLVI